MKPNRVPFPQPVIWVKTPKCAGSSFRHFLIDHDLFYLVDAPETISYDALKTAAASNVLVVRHAKLRILEERFPEWVEGAWIFMIVRNPWDRFISGWRYCESTRRRFLSDVARRPPLCTEHLQDWHHLTRPLSEFAFSSKGVFLIDHVCHMENLPEDLKPVFHKIGIADGVLPVKNTNAHHYYKDYYRDNEWALVAHRYIKDIETFGYGDDQPPTFTLTSWWIQQKTKCSILWNRLLRALFRQPT